MKNSLGKGTESLCVQTGGLCGALLLLHSSPLWSILHPKPSPSLSAINMSCAPVKVKLILHGTVPRQETDV